MLTIMLHTRVAVGARPDDGELFHVKTTNLPQAELALRLWRARSNSQGTLIMCHGFGRSMEDFLWYGWIRDRLGWNVIRFDFREHGESSHEVFGLPTLGYFEIYDVKAIIDWAEEENLPKPYVCYGHSMGAAIALRWAGQDRRISGVLGQSPFKSALDATTKFRPDDYRVQFARGVLVRSGFEQMLNEVDICKAVAQRDDLLLWLSSTRQDWFGEADQREILRASASPDELKRFVAIPVEYHGDQWMWKGNDRFIEDFLARAWELHHRAPPPSRASVISPITAGVILAGILCYRVKRRWTR
jgi:pimeloyl-ACP methyl ester carboxylesterase